MECFFRKKACYRRVDTKRQINAGLTLVHRVRRWERLKGNVCNSKSDLRGASLRGVRGPWLLVPHLTLWARHDMIDSVISDLSKQEPFRPLRGRGLVYCFYPKKSSWRRLRAIWPQDPKNVHYFLITVRPVSWACGHETKMLLLLKKLFSTWLFEGKS